MWQPGGGGGWNKMGLWIAIYVRIPLSYVCNSFIIKSSSLNWGKNLMKVIIMRNYHSYIKMISSQYWVISGAESGGPRKHIFWNLGGGGGGGGGVWPPRPPWFLHLWSKALLTSMWLIAWLKISVHRCTISAFDLMTMKHKTLAPYYPRCNYKLHD